MKIENPDLFNAYDYILVTDAVTNQDRPWEGLFQCLSGPIPFYDYVNYYVAALGSVGESIQLTLNGNTTQISGLTLHVPNFQTGGVQQSTFNSLVQYWAAVDSLDVQLQITLHGTQLFQLTQDQTQLTSANVGVGIYMTTPQYAYGTQIIPTFIISNTNPAIAIASLGLNQGIQTWGNRYKVVQLKDVKAREIYEAKRYTSVTVQPPNF